MKCRSTVLSLLFSALAYGEPIKTPETDADLIDNIPEVDLKKKKPEPEKAEEENEKVEEAEVALPEVAQSFIIEKGDTLGKVSEKAYGRTRYWRILKLYNECDPSKLKVGQKIKAPELKWLLASCKFSEHFPEISLDLLKIKSDLITIEDSQPDKKYTENTLKQLDELGTLTGKITEKLKESAKLKAVKTPPYATLKQLRTCRQYLNMLAAQKKVGRRDLNALIHEHLSNALVYAVLWAKSDFK